MLGSQVILSLVILFILFKTAVSYKEKKLSSSFVIVWLIFWIGIFFLVHYPNLLVRIANILGVGRGVDFALYVSVILIFYLLYRLSEKIIELESKITKLVRSDTLKRNENG